MSNIENQTPPTKEEVVAFLTEQIEVKKLQAELQELNARIATSRFKELESLSFIGQLTSPSSKEAEPELHTLTQEDLDKNPELTKQGLKVGDEVYVASSTSKRSLKKGK